MRTKHIILLLLPVFVLLSLASASYGLVGLVRNVYFDVWTQQSPGATAPDLQLQLWVKVQDSKGLRGPDAVNWAKPFTVKAPTGEVFNLDVNTWDEFNDGFMLGVHATDFTGGVISKGKYTVSFTDTSGRVCTAWDTINPVTFLAIPTVNDPLDNATVASLTPTLKWNAVAGATLYRLELTPVGANNTWAFPPLYARPYTHKDVGTTSFTIPQGVLKYNTHYVFRIEARDSDKNMSGRSRSIWVHFTTPPAP